MQIQSAAPEFKPDKQVARPLQVLAPLIRKDLEEGKEAAQRAGLPYYRAAGEKMLEAKAQVAHGEFQDWIKRNFKISPRTARHYMDLAAATQNGNAFPFSSLRDSIREIRDARSPHQEPIDFAELRQEQAKREQESELQRKLQHKLALELISAGYKALALKLHPDKDGSDEAMKRLNHVRDLLRKRAP
jgi:hypothetical protein